jgi:hypothetical protein
MKPAPPREPSQEPDGERDGEPGAEASRSPLQRLREHRPGRDVFPGGLLGAAALAVFATSIIGLLVTANPPSPQGITRLPQRVVEVLDRMSQAPIGVWAMLASMVLLARVAWGIATREGRLPAYLLGAGLVVIVAGYRWSNVDWLQVSHRARVADGGVPDPMSIAWALVPMAAVILYNLFCQAAQGEADAIRRGIEPAEARRAKLVTAPAFLSLGVAGGATMGLAVAFPLFEAPAGSLPVVPNVALFPLVAAGLLFAVALLAARRGRRKAT